MNKDKAMYGKIMWDRGKTWITYLQFMMILFLVVDKIKDLVWFKEISTTALLVISFIAVNVGIFAIGFIEIKLLGTFQKEMENRSKLNPIIVEQMRMLREILRKLEGDNDRRNRDRI